MKASMLHSKKGLAALKKRPSASDTGEKSAAAQEDRLRISSFQTFWKNTLENIYLLRAIRPGFAGPVKMEKIMDYKKLPDDSWLIHPQDPLKVGWDFFVGIVIFYSILIVPYKIGFQIVNTFAENVVEWTVAFIFFLDILASFNSAYVSVNTDRLVYDRNIITKTYMKFWFWIDTVSTIPFDLLTSSASASSIRLVKVLRLVRLMKLFRIIKLSKFAKRFDDININPSILNVWKLMFQIVFVAHLVACFWFFITTVSVTGIEIPEEADLDDNETLPVSWVSDLGITYQPVSDQYVAAFYWTVTTMLSIGYGDILPTNSTERIYAMSVMMIGGVLFGAVIAQVTKFIESRNPQAKAFKARMDELKAYLTEKSSGHNALRKEIVTAYNYYLMRKSTFAESGIFDDLPKGMLVKLVHTIYDKEIAEVDAFRQYNPRFVVHLVINSQPFQAREGEIIAHQTDVSEEIIFIASGMVRMSVSRGLDENILVGYAKDGDYFGDFEYVKKCARLANYSAAYGCNLLSIDYSVLDGLEGEHADAYEEFMTILRDRYDNFCDVKCLPYTRKQSTDQLLEFSCILLNGKICDPAAMNMSQKQTSDHSHQIRYRVLREDEVEGKIKLDEMTSVELYDMWILHPKFTEKVFWDMFVGVLIVWSVLSAPVQIAFADDSNRVVDWFLVVMFFIDMVLSFRTAYLSEDDDAYVILPEMVHNNYIRTWFGIDLVSTIPFDELVGLFMGGASNLSAIKLVKTVRLLRLARLLRLSKIRTYLMKLEDAFGIPPALFNIISMYIQVLFIAHLVACMWWGLTTVMSEETWYDDVAFQGPMRSSPTAERYILALYWTLTTLATVGYGEITPVNTSERILCVFVMILGATVFGYIVANVSALMGQMDQAGARIVERVSEVTEYLNEKNCPKPLADSIIKHFRHMFNQRSAFDEDAILKRLPRKLRNKLLLSQRGEIMESIPIFRYLSNTSVAMYIYSVLDPLYFEVNQLIVREHDLAHDVHFIISGVAHVFRKVRLKRDASNKKRRTVARMGSVIGQDARASKKKDNAFPTIQERIQHGRKHIANLARSLSTKGSSKKPPAPPPAEGEKPKVKVKLNTEPQDADFYLDTSIWSEYHRYKVTNREKGREFLGEIAKGDFVGHVALLKNRRHEASAIAYRSCSCYVLSRADIGKITREHDHVALFLQDAMARATREMEDKVGKQNIKALRAEYLFNLRRGYLQKLEERNQDINAKVAKMNALAEGSRAGAGQGSFTGHTPGSNPMPNRNVSVDLTAMKRKTMDSKAFVNKSAFSQPGFSPASPSGKLFEGKQSSNSFASPIRDSARSSENGDISTISEVPPGIGEGGVQMGQMIGQDAKQKYVATGNVPAGKVVPFSEGGEAEGESSVGTDAPQRKSFVSDVGSSAGDAPRPRNGSIGAFSSPRGQRNSGSSKEPGLSPASRAMSMMIGGPGSPRPTISHLLSPSRKFVPLIFDGHTIFNDENLLFDVDDEEDEWAVIKKDATFRRSNSCPEFRSLLAHLPWIPTKVVVAETNNSKRDINAILSSSKLNTSDSSPEGGVTNAKTLSVGFAQSGLIQPSTEKISAVDVASMVPRSFSGDDDEPPVTVEEILGAVAQPRNKKDIHAIKEKERERERQHQLAKQAESDAVAKSLASLGVAPTGGKKTGPTDAPRSLMSGSSSSDDEPAPAPLPKKKKKPGLVRCYSFPSLHADHHLARAPIDALV